MIRARIWQLNLELSSFLSNPFRDHDNRLLPNDVINLKNIEEGHEVLRERHRDEEDQQGHPNQEGGPAKLSSSLARPP